MAQNNQELLTRLKDGGLQFVVIGGVCGIYHGTGMATFDLDICCPFGEENVQRIEAAVKDLNPVHRLTANKLPLEMTRSSFPLLKNLYLQTDFGKLDCLGDVAGVGDFDAVQKQSEVARFSYGEFRFLKIDALIEAKRTVGRAHDMEAVRRLVAIKERIGKQTD